MNPSTRVHGTGTAGGRSADAGAQQARPDTRLSAALVALRVAAGAVFVAHGGQKLFVYGLEGVTASFDGMGIPLAGVAAPAVALIEALGGLALAGGGEYSLDAVLGRRRAAR